MLKRKLSLKGEKKIELIFKKGKGFKESFLALKYIPSPQQNSHFGIIVSQKISKKATVRNKIKRRIRAILLHKQKMIEKPIECVLIVFPGAEKKHFKEIDETISNLFKKAGLFKKQNL